MNEQNLPPENNNQKNKNENFIDNIVDKTSKFAEIEKPEGFSLQEMFSEIFRKHSEQEVEEYFTVGVESTTPKIEDVDTSWPKPWVFFKTLVGTLVIYFCFVMAWNEFKNPNILPGLITIGSFAIPFSTLIFFFETNVRKNVSLYQIIRLILFGGILSLIFSLFLFRVSYSLNLNILGASLAGIVEEIGKLIALVLVINNRKYPYILNGLLFGAAIGTGFAAFESAGYALGILLQTGDPNAMLDNILLRGILSPFGHIVWTGMSAALLWKVKGDREFNFEMVKDRRFLKVFGIAVGLHMVWNGPIQLPFYLTQVFSGFIAWVVIFGIVQEGLKQLREEKMKKNLNLRSR